jgi:peptidoglycan/xylan/chitin deacetylase (PgdA/CDA1 family)
VTIVSAGVRRGSGVALTFDDGPAIPYTAKILDVFAELGGRATFFVRGAALSTVSHDVVRRAAAQGHEIGNHTYGHRSLASLDDATVRDEIGRTHTLLEEIVGSPPTLIRPPYGADAARVDRIAAGLGYRSTVLWSVHGHDWEGPPAGQIAASILDSPALRPGAIVLLHDGSETTPAASRRSTVDALRTLVPELRARGYELVTVSELLDVRPSPATLVVDAWERARRALKAQLVGRGSGTESR